MATPEHVTRMQDERKELEVKTRAAEVFYMKEPTILDNKQRSLLRHQIGIMNSYIQVLDERIRYDIALAEKEDAKPTES